MNLHAFAGRMHFNRRLSLLTCAVIWTVVTCQAFAQSAPSTTKGNAASTRPLPKSGIAKFGEGVFALSTTDLGGKVPKGFCGSLGRELFRQSLLIAARDELGLVTLDTSIGDLTYTTNSPAAFPYELAVTFDQIPGDVEQFAIGITLTHPETTGPWFEWKSEPLKSTVKEKLESLAELAEKLSRNEFSAALKQAGYQKRDAADVKIPKSPPDFEGHLDFIAQFGVLRQLHAQRSVEGDSIENLGSLIRTYANLGNLIDFHWSSGAKAFKARSLIYAQRMLAKYGQSPYTLAHRAYARALTGTHVKAIDDINLAKDANGRPAPDWLKLIAAVCEYQPVVLEETEGPLKELALYLRMRLVDPHFDRDAGLAAIEQFMITNAACPRSVELMCEMHSIGLLRSVTEGGADQTWPDVYQRLSEVPNLPSKSLTIANRQRDRSKPAGQAVEHRARVDLIDDLRRVGNKSTERIEPSWQALAELIADVTYVQTWRVVDTETTMLGVKSDQSIEQLYRLVKGHRYANCIKCYSSDRAAAGAALLELLKSADPTAVELPSIPLAVMAYRINPDFYRRVFDVVYRHRDMIYDDILRSGVSNVPELRSYVSEWLHEISPYQPRTIAWLLNSNQQLSDEQAREWEQKYSDNAQVMLALGQKYRVLTRPDDAERCLKKSIASTPTYDAYFALANEYRDRRDLKAARETFQEALSLPSYGLEQSNTHVEIARILMHEGEWEQAKPHALAAAQAYSANGLLTAARCGEGLKDWDMAEQFYQAVSERYDSTAEEWYFYCIRRQRGELKAARDLATRMFSTWTAPFSSDQIWNLATQAIFEDDLKKAKQIFTDPENKQHQSVYTFLMAALLADKLGETADRDSYYLEIEVRYDPTYPLPTLVHLFRSALRQPNNFQWNRNSFDELVDFAQASDVAFMYYCAGTFLDIHGERELAKEYLQCTATSQDVRTKPCVLANHALHSQKLEVGTTRYHTRPDARFPSFDVFFKHYRSQREAKLDQARQQLDEAIQLRPDFVLAYLARGELSVYEGKYEQATTDFRAVLNMNPDCEKAINGLATLLSSCDQDNIRNGDEALKLAQHAYDARFTKTWVNLSVLAAAYAEKGQFDKAVELMDSALKLTPDNQELQHQAKLYRDKKPSRFPKRESGESPKQ